MKPDHLILAHANVGGMHVFMLVDERGTLVANGIPLEDEKAALETLRASAPALPKRAVEADDEARRLAEMLVRRMLEGGPVEARLRKPGSPFAIKVLTALLSIPRGRVTSYAALAELLGSSPRAVARALASNPYPIIFPCHRVVRADGRLGGYLGGARWTWLKARLLRLEGVPIKNGRVPPEALVGARELRAASLNRIADVIIWDDETLGRVQGALSRDD